ncbi:MAG: hypothetical protein LBC44_05005 [Mycoplasmataceae bacterium]|nr:hypothetical protein [Mycoplasmataceae bacterium]
MWKNINVIGGNENAVVHLLKVINYCCHDENKKILLIDLKKTFTIEKNIKKTLVEGAEFYSIDTMLIICVAKKITKKLSKKFKLFDYVVFFDVSSFIPETTNNLWIVEDTQKIIELGADKYLANLFHILQKYKQITPTKLENFILYNFLNNQIESIRAKTAIAEAINLPIRIINNVPEKPVFDSKNVFLSSIFSNSSKEITEYKKNETMIKEAMKNIQE